MDYAKHYWALIERARNRRPLVRCYFERHHILPRCMGGSDDDDNLVRLTPEEHYVAHRLLAKMHPDNDKLAYASLSMSRRAGFRSSGAKNKRYARAVQRMSDAARFNWRNGWAMKFRHRPRRKKRFGTADVNKMRIILAPKQVST